MLRHVVVFRFVDDTSPTDIETIAGALRTLPARIPQIADYRVGPDAGLTEGNWDFGVVADFASVEDYVAYRDDPEHRRIVTELIRPHIAARAALQYEIDGGHARATVEETELG